MLDAIEQVNPCGQVIMVRVCIDMLLIQVREVAAAAASDAHLVLNYVSETLRGCCSCTFHLEGTRPYRHLASCSMLSLLHTSFVRHCHASRLGKSSLLHTLDVSICRQPQPSAHEPSRFSVRPQTTTSIHSLSHSLLATGLR
jgi:hypothetical protein